MTDDITTLEQRAADPSAPAPTALPPSTRLIITLLLVSSFVVILNETIMGVAIPNISREVGVEVTTGQWLTTAFMLTMAVVIPITGYLLQRFNTRPVYLLAMTLFSIGTLVCALAPGFGMLVVGRVIQASGTAVMMPLFMTTVMTLVPPSARGKTMGTISIVMSVAPAIGPTISGLILSTLHWRWIFGVVLPIAVFALVLGALRVPNVSTPRRAPIDVVSVLLSAVAFGGLIYGLSGLGEAAEGPAPVPPAAPIAIGAVALVAFVLRQVSLQRVERALLDLRTFTVRNFSLSISLMFLLMMTLFGTLILLPVYMQNVLALEPLTIGLLLLPGGLLMGLLGPVVGRIFDRRGPKVLLVPGAIVVSLALWSMTLLSESTPFMLVLVVHVGLSAGLGLMFTPLFTSALGSVRPELYSHGSAVLGTVQQLAGAAGTALFVVVMAVRQASLESTGASEVHATAGGVRAAFLCGAVLSLLAIVAAYFVRKPEDLGDHGAAHGDTEPGRTSHDDESAYTTTA